MTRHDVADFVGEHRGQLAVVSQLHQRRRYVNMSARQREAVDFATLDHVELVKQSWPQARLRAVLPDALNPIEAAIGQPESLGDFAMKLRAQLDLVTLTQQS